LHIFNLLQ